MRKFSSVITLIFLTSSLLAMGCASGEIDENNPKDMYAEAEDDIKSDRFQMALDRLRQVKNRFPYSSYSVKAKLRIADVYFMQELFAEAAASYELFRDMHPRHPKVPYAMYRISKSYFNDTPENLARDMTAGFRAEETYAEFLRRYPSSTFANDARKELQLVKERLASKELYVANFYRREEKYGSAKARYKKVIKTYPATEAAKKAKSSLEKLPSSINPEENS